MSRKLFLLNGFMILALLLALLPVQNAPLLPHVTAAKAASTGKPVVAIHVSELTQALESMLAVSPTPTGTGYSGYQWFVTSWHYFAIYESLKTAFDSDGTPYALVTDADIAAGALLDAGLPRYPIVFSLATEATNNNEVQPLRDYVNAGGFLFVGSSAFTRNPDGTTRSNFALASEMGLNMANRSLQNWSTYTSFSRLAEHRLAAHIPSQTIPWDMITNADDVTWPTVGSQQAWQVSANGAEIILNSSGGPVLATKPYGAGRFIYHAAFNPIVAAGGNDSGMYAYTIYRNAVEWAFEAANLPIIKRSPWPYAYDAAFLVRHDYEGDLGALATIETSAQYEKSVGVKGDYYFTTGALRTISSASQQTYIARMRSAVTNYSATIGSHNGGYPDPAQTDPTSEEYFHWGPDPVLDRTTFSSPYQSYTSGYNYSKDSIRISFEDLAGWLAGTDNGRPGCGAAGNCPRTWVAPSFNSGRDRSMKMLEELGAITVGEQKISPFPHWSLSYDPANPDHRYNHLSLPVSDWYVGTTIAQSIGSHTDASVRALVDFYYQKGYLINLYGHNSSSSGIEKTYVDYAVSKPRNWSTNAVGLYDWWVKRDSLVVTPNYALSGDTAVASASISGAVDPQEAVELVLPYWSSGIAGNLDVRLNGAPASPSEFRATNYGVKVRVGTTVTNLEIRYTPLKAWVQTGWSGGAGQTAWSDPARFETSSGLSTSLTGQLTLNLAAPGAPLFSDDFNRTTPLSPWLVYTGTWALAGQTLRGTAGGSGSYANAYYVPATAWTDYSAQARVQFPTGATGGGGLAGRLNSASGKRYTAWIYPGNSTLRLMKYSTWTSMSRLAEVSIPPVGTDWHTIQMDFTGSRIRVFWDGSLLVDAKDGSSPYLSGGIGLDTSAHGGTYLMAADDVRVDSPVQFETSSWLNSSAFDAGMNGSWYAITWNAAAPASTSVCLRTRTADQADLLAASGWSDCYAASGAEVTSPDKRWLQYRLELQTIDGNETPIFFDNRVSYTTISKPANVPPTAGNDSYSTNEDTPLTITSPGVLSNDSDAEGNALAAVKVSDPAHGTLALNADGSFNYTPAANYNGPDSFTYKANDSALDSAPATVSITIHPVNDPPVAGGDSYSTDRDQKMAIPAPGVLANDSDIDSATLKASLVSGPAHGDLALNVDGSFTYIPAADYAGSDSFIYKANDGALDSKEATVAITVRAVNRAPKAADDSYSTAEDTPLNIAPPGVLSNDSDADGNPLTVVKASDPIHGTLSLNADGSFTYTPTANYNGPDSFTYTANDGQLNSALAAVSITINPINDPPVAADDSYTTPQDTALAVPAKGVLANDADSDSDALSAVLVTGPAFGTLTLSEDGSFIYTPNAGYIGSDSFTYRANDGMLDSNVAAVAINISNVNHIPKAVDDSYSANEDTPLAITAPGVLLNDHDSDGSVLTAVKVNDPGHGTLTLHPDGSFTYTPTADYSGPDSFTYQASDGQVNSAAAVVSVTVNPVNDPPVAADDSYNTDQNQPLVIAAPGVLNNDNDIDSSTLTAALASDPEHGEVALNANGSFTYTPAANYNGPDSFTYTANDGQIDSAPAVVSITVKPANDPPVAKAQSVTTSEDTGIAITLTGSDLEGSPLTFTIVTGPAHGTLSGTAPNVTYTPAANYSGTDSFTFRVNDGSLDSAPAAVSITVSPVNDSPVAVNDSAATNQNTAVTIQVLNNDTDVDGDTLIITSVSTPANGQTLINAGATLTYTPKAGWTGTDSFTYTISDGHGGTATANVSITVAPGPVIFSDHFNACSASAWTSTTNASRISFNQAAAWDAPCGMAIDVLAGQSVYLMTETPTNETHYSAKFYFDPNTISWGTNSDLDIFSIKDGSVNHLTLATIEFRYAQRSYMVRFSVYNDLGKWVYSPWVKITDQGHFITLDYQAATAAGANNGAVNLWVDGTLATSMKSIDIDKYRVERAQFGAFNAPSSGVSGTLYFDAFESNR